MCPEHVKSPLVSLSYPGVASSPKKGSSSRTRPLHSWRPCGSIANSSGRDGSNAANRNRPACASRGRKLRSIVAGASASVYRLFIVGCIVAAILAGVAIGGIAMLVVPKDKGRHPNPPPPSSAAESRSAGPGTAGSKRRRSATPWFFGEWDRTRMMLTKNCAARLPLTSWPAPRVPWVGSVGKAADDIG